MALAPMTHAATRLMLASKKSSPMCTLGRYSPRTSSFAISRSSSERITTWSLSQRTPPADVQQQPIDPQQHRGDLVGNHLGGVEVARIQTKNRPARRRVSQVELVRADDIALRAETEELAFDRVEIVLAVQRLAEDFVQRFDQSHSRFPPVRGQVLEAVRDPDIGHAGRAERLAERRPDAATRPAVVDPEPAGARVSVSECETVSRSWVGEECGVEVQTESLLTSPIRPAGEVFRLQFVPFDGCPSGLGVDRVQVESVAAGYKGQRLFEVHAEFRRRSCLPGMVSRDSEASSDLFVSCFETSNVVPLPAMQRECDRGKRAERQVAVNAQTRITFPRKGICLVR